MTDITKYRNVSLTHQTYKTLINLSKVLLPDAKLSISKTIEQIANEKAKKLNGKIKKIESIFTYKNSYPDANKSLSFINSREIKFNKNIRTKKLTFKYLNKKYTITSKYSFDLVKFYSTFPQSDYRVYLNSNNSDLLSQTLLKQMQKYLGKT